MRMSQAIRCRVVGALAVAALPLLGACGVDGMSNKGSAPPSSTTVIDESGRLYSYSSLGEMKRQTDFVFRGMATSTARVVHLAVHDFTVTTVKVDEVLKGDPALVGSSVEVRQGRDADDIPVIGTGKTYVFFTIADHFPKEGPQAQYWPRGAFAVDNGVATDLDPLSALPKAEQKLSLDELRRAIGF